MEGPTSDIDEEGMNKLGEFYGMRDNFTEFSNLTLHNMLQLKVVDKSSVLKLRTLLQDLNNFLYFDTRRLIDFQFASTRYTILKAVHQKIITYIEQLAQKENHPREDRGRSSSLKSNLESRFDECDDIEISAPKRFIAWKFSEEKRFHEMLEQLKYVVSGIIMAYSNLCEMPSIVKLNYKKCFDRNSSYEWRSFDAPEDTLVSKPAESHYDELPCKHAKETTSLVNCRASKASSTNEHELSDDYIEELTRKVTEWCSWVNRQISTIQRLKEGRTPVRSNSELKTITEEISENCNNATELIKDLLVKCEKIESEHRNELSEDFEYADRAKKLQHLIEKSKKLKQGWQCLDKCLGNLENHVLQTLKHLQELSKQESMLENLLDQTEAQSTTNSHTVDGSATINIPQQIEFNASLLQNLSDQECILKRLNELFDELKVADASGGYGSVSVNKVQNLNVRWKDLTTSLSNRINALKNILEVSPVSLNINSFDMMGSVTSPWKRVIAANEYPYYTNTRTMKTTWDHPHMSIMIESLGRYNDIRFCAYRTSMKLRALQRWLLLDLCDLQNVSNVFTGEFVNTQTFDGEGFVQNSDELSVSRLMTILRRMYEVAAVSNAIPMNIPRATDLCLNWLILLYDPQRRKELKTFECQIAIVMMCRAPIEEKYAYIFDMCACTKPTMPLHMLHKFIASSLAVPAWLDEVDAFGGKDPEPSVQSYLEQSSQSEITKDSFLSWVRLEPQSLVWLPVLHRLSASEGTRHEAKCNICKEYPIIGFRYRSLRRFNFDVCQKCFFFGRSAIELNVDDPLQEYYIETTSSDDIRDFFKIFANKFKRGVKVRTKLGYLPISKSTHSRSSTRSDSPGSTQRRTSFTGCLSESQSENPLMPPVFDHDQLGEQLGGVEEHSAVANYCRILSEHKTSDINGHKMPKASKDNGSSSSFDTGTYSKHDSPVAATENRMSHDLYRHVSDNQPIRRIKQSISSVRSSPAAPNSYNVHSPPFKDDLENQRLFEHYKQKLENRLSTLEDHNAKLEHQLCQVRQMIKQRQIYVAQEPPSNKLMATANVSSIGDGQVGKDTSSMPINSTSPFSSPHKSRQAVSNLFHCANDINKAVGSLVSLMAKDVKVTNID